MIERPNLFVPYIAVPAKTPAVADLLRKQAADRRAAHKGKK